MTIYKVAFERIDWDAYFSGSWACTCTAEEFFATKEKAEEFIKAPLDEYVPTWKRYETIKEAGAGEIYEIEIEAKILSAKCSRKQLTKCGNMFYSSVSLMQSTSMSTLCMVQKP